MRMERAATRAPCPVASEVSGSFVGCIGNEENRPVARPARTQALQFNAVISNLRDQWIMYVILGGECWGIPVRTVVPRTLYNC